MGTENTWLKLSVRDYDSSLDNHEPLLPLVTIQVIVIFKGLVVWRVGKARGSDGVALAKCIPAAAIEPVVGGWF